jgi:hypothetical protein
MAATVMGICATAPASRTPCPLAASPTTPTLGSAILEGMFERFTDRARRVLVLAQEEARLLDHNFIGTEHILLGLIHEGDGVAAKALEAVGISLEAVREKVEETIGPAGISTTGSPPFTPRAKKVLELSLREALQLGHNYIGTEHILLGLVREGEGVAAQVLISLGADMARVRQQVARLLAGYQSPDDTGSDPSPGTIYAGPIYRRAWRRRSERRRWVRRHAGLVGLFVGCVSGGLVTGIAAALLGGRRLPVRRSVVIRLSPDQTAALAAGLQRRRGRH